MKARHVLIVAVTILLLASLLIEARCDAPLIDETVTVKGEDIYSKIFYANLTEGDRVSISITVTGDPIRFWIYDSTNPNQNVGKLYSRINITSLNEEWTAPYSDKFGFIIDSLEGTSDVQIIVRKVGEGGFDPLPIVVITVVVLVVLVSTFLAVRLRRKPSLPPPEEPPPPPP